MRRLYIILSVVLSVAVFASCGRKGESAEALAQTILNESENVEESSRLHPCQDSLICREGKVRNGQFFSTLLTSLGLSAGEAYNLTQSCGDVFDVRTLRIGNSYKAYYSSDTLQYLVYDRDRTSQIIFQCQPPYEISVCEKTVTVEKRYADVTISNSLWVDMTNAGVSPNLILSLSDIYAWTVDFFGLQKGDRFRVLYDERMCEDEVIAVDTVRYAIFTHNGTDYPAVMYSQEIYIGTRKGRA